jgi:hypothetical protein
MKGTFFFHNRVGWLGEGLAESLGGGFESASGSGGPDQGIANGCILGP